MTTFTTYATATFATGNIVVVQSAENMIPGLPITFSGNTFGNLTPNATYYIGNITFGFPTSNITLTSLPGGAVYPVGNGSGNMTTNFSQGGQQIIPTVPPGEPLNQAFDAINVNFDQIWAAGPVGSNIQIDENTIYTLNTNGNLVLNPNGIGNVIANAHVIPDRDRVRNLGASLLRWNTIYAQNIVGNISGNVGAGGANTQVQFNDGGFLSASPGFTFDKTTNAVAITGSITAGNVLTPGIVSSVAGLYGDIYTTLIDSGDSSAILVIPDITMLASLNINQDLEVDNEITAVGNITGSYYFGNGSQLTGITADNVNADDLIGNTLSGNVLYSSLITVGDLTSLSVVGNTTTGNLDTAGLVSAAGNVTGGNLLFGSGIVSGTGNIYANKIFANIQGNIDAAGNLYEIQFNTTGDQLGANANFTYDFANNVLTVASGNIVAGNVSAVGNISANYYFGNGSQLTGVAAASVNANALVGNTLSGNVIFSSLTTVGNLVDLSVVGTATTGNLVTAGFVSAAGNIISGSNIAGGNVLTAGVVSAGANITGGNVLTGGTVSATSTIQGGNIVTAGDVTATGAVTGGNIYTGGVVSAVSTITGGNLATAGTITATGTVTGGNLVTAGYVSATGNVSGANLSTAGNVTAANVSANNGFFGNLNLTGDIAANSLSSNTVVSATGTGTFGNVLTGGIVSATGNVTGNYFIGNGAFLTGIDTTLISNGNTNVQTYANGNVAVTVTGVANTVVFTVAGVDVTGTVSASGNVTGGNLVTGGAVSAAGNVTGANVNTTTIWSSSDLNLQPVGNVALGNRYVTGVRYPSADQDAASKIYVDNLVSTAISYHEAVTAATTTDLATTTGGTITYNQPGGAGNGIGATLTTTGSFNLIDTANVQTANTRILVKNEANATHNGVYVWSNATVITRSSDADTAGVGNAFALGLNDYFFVTNGNVNLGSAWIVDAPTSAIVFGTSNIEFAQFSQSQIYSANVSAGLSLIGTVFSAKVDNNTTAFDGGGNISVKAGANLTTPNIGAATGTSLSATGNVAGGNIVTVGYVTATGNVAGGNIVTAGNITATGNVAGNYFVGNGSQLTGVTASSVDAANLTGNTLSSNVLFSSLTTVGTLTSLSVSGNVDGGNIHTAGVVSAAGAVTGGNLITSGSVTATGDVTAGNIFTGGAVSATGTGTFGNVLTGGVISATSTIQGGNVLTAGEVSAGGAVTGGNIYTGGVVSAVSTITGGNLATAGTVTATGTVTGGNLVTAGTVSSTGTGTFGNVDTAGTVSATGTITSANAITGANINTAGIVSAAGNVIGGNILFGSGIVSGTGNIYANNIFANISGNIDAAGNINEVQFNGAGDILTASAGFTFDPAGNILTANGNINGANVFTGGIVSAAGNITGNTVVVGNILIPSSGNVTLGNVNINNLAEPVANSDAATKFYVDSVAANVLPIITNQTITPNGSANTFVLDQSTTAVGVLVTINGVTQTPTVDYTVTGNSITIGETPLNTDIIQVRYLSGTTTGGSGGTNYANANVVAYAESGWGGNIIPQGNLTYNLGNNTNRWNDLYLSGNTIYLDAATIGANGVDVVFSGNLSLPGNGIIANPANTSLDPFNPNVSTMVLKPDSNYSQELVIDPTAPGHIHIRTNTYGNIDEPAANLFLGGELSSFEVGYYTGTAPNVFVHSNGNTWTFDNTGNLTLPQGMIVSGNTNFLGTDTALLNPADNTPLSLFTSGVNGTVTSFWAEDVGNLMSSNIAAFYLPLQGSQTVRIVNGSNGGNIAIYDFDTDGMFTTAAVCATGNVYAGNVSSSGNVTVGGNLSVTGNIIGNVVTRFESFWTVPTGNSTQSFTVTPNETYYLWVDCNIPNGILAWNATATVTNTNVPVVGAQYAWVYNGGGTPIDFTSIPNQFVGTANTIVRSSVAPSATTNRFDFGINNTSGNSQTVRYGWIQIS
jgi:hypothetical protein